MHTATGRKIVLLERTTCGDIRGRAAVVEQLRPMKPETWAVVTAAFLAGLAFSFLGAYLLYLARVNYSPNVYYQHVTLSMLGWPEVLGGTLLAALSFVFVYPVAGLIVTSLCGGLAAAVAGVYRFERGERWHPNAILIFAASWPATMWAIPLLAFAWGLGLVCRPLWKQIPASGTRVT